MDIRELISFYHTARLSSVSQAARFLELGQPTVTAHLQRLELDVGSDLFDRNRRPIKLTAQGSKLFELARPLVSSMERGLESLNNQMTDPDQQGSFSIGSYPDLALHYLPPVLQGYRSRYPEAAIKVLTNPYQVLMRSLEAGDVDMAVVHTPEEQVKDVSFVHLFDAPFNLLAPIGHPILDSPSLSLETIAEWPLILLSQHSYTRRRFELAMSERGLQCQVGLEMDNSELVRKYVEIGMGIAVTTTDFSGPNHQDSSRLRVLDLSHLLPPVQIGLAVKTRRDLSAAAWEFIADLKAAAVGAEPLPTRLSRVGNP
ncbi:MAG: LysR family transcriptional regulator [Chloroflexi bacterium]|nr:LysR family transcriptional regulator [Chloroflexota bacterium]